ncbi:hypothetical protein OBJ96_05265 [Empedobacter falsenii]|uniref:hypothetical protein n=1 Tax=Empedobacter stercoris TaxID=1628248 RepID=UPI001CE1C73E|nr:hypothetical protein [Empedobacter stercoris]
MAKRKIVWTKTAHVERKEILEYWLLRNKSNRFSIKLNQLILEILDDLKDNPTIGRKTSIKNVRVNKS